MSQWKVYSQFLLFVSIRALSVVSFISVKCFRRSFIIYDSVLFPVALVLLVFYSYDYFFLDFL